MSALETFGLFWTILATGCFTAAVLIAAGWSITLGIAVAIHRYRLGEEMEQTLQTPDLERSGRR